MNSLFNDSQKKILREAFRLFDVDGNGLLSKEVLQFVAIVTIIHAQGDGHVTSRNQ